MRVLASAFVLSLAGIAGAAADDAAPGEAQAIDLGEIRGIAYYTVDAGGYRVVATLASEAGTPMRVTATLAPEQRMDLSVPGAAGEAPYALAFVRRGDRLEVVRQEIASN